MFLVLLSGSGEFDSASKLGTTTFEIYQVWIDSFNVPALQVHDDLGLHF